MGTRDARGAWLLSVSPISGGGAARRWRIPAEWEPQERTWLAWPTPSAEWPDLVGAREAVTTLAHLVSMHQPVRVLCRPEQERLARRSLSRAIEVWVVDLDDVWMRDVGPVFVVDDHGGKAGVDFRFNGWGGKWPSEADDALASFVAEQCGIESLRSELTLEGGALSTDGRGTVLVTRECALDPNRNPGWSVDEVSSELRRLVVLERLVWLEQGLVEDHTDGHVDEIAVFVGPNRVLVCRAGESTSRENSRRLAVNREILEAARDGDGRAFEIVDVPLPGAGALGSTQRSRGADGTTELALSYANFVVGNDFVVVPVFSDRARDDEALGIFEEHFEGRRIYPFSCHPIWLNGGGPHCLSLNEPLALDLGASFAF